MVVDLPRFIPFVPSISVSLNILSIYLRLTDCPPYKVSLHGVSGSELVLFFSFLFFSFLFLPLPNHSNHPKSKELAITVFSEGLQWAT